MYLSNHWGWHSPFLLIVAIGILFGIVIAWRLQPINGHLALKAERSAFQHLLHTITQARYLQGFATTAFLANGGFLIMPFSSAFSVNNLKVTLEQLPLVYTVTGMCSMVAAPLIGRIMDKVGSINVFLWGSIVSIVLVLIYTNLDETPLAIVVAISFIMFVGISARMISSAG